MTAGPARPGGARPALPGDCGRGLPTGRENRSLWRHAGRAAVGIEARRPGQWRGPSACSANQSTAAWVRSSQATTLNPVGSSAPFMASNVTRKLVSEARDQGTAKCTGPLFPAMTSCATRASGGRQCSSRQAASRRGRRVLRWNRDLRALKNAFQRRDAGRDIAFPAVFQRHSGVQGPGIAVRVVAVI